ncbi:rRNA processing/ribosome biogenesis-domain-containing protein [Astrocystis sublimbata]|nr:rRNA processing/ribosome biogenesis-domain-containing protein [Astrocystis sublimbata]
MALVSLPPELRTICRQLTSTKIEQLPSLLPTLLKDVDRCGEPLSRPVEPKSSESSPEAAVLVHNLKTQITTLLNGRTTQGRFVGAALVKSVVENGGWECLRASEAWVRGLIAIIQKKDPTVTKELSIVALVKIFTLMHEYPTLVREIVTPNLPGFAKACLQILKPPASSKVGKAPYSLVETIFEAISTLLPLYPTTLREFAGKFRTEARPFWSPTISDNVLIPTTLQASSRRLGVRLHMTAAKGGDSTEWTKHVEELVKTVHSTADQVFRTVQEIWESTTNYKPQAINLDVEPQGGGDLDQLPRWVGVQAGSERIIGLLDFIGEYLHCRTRVAVAIPVSAIADITSRISAIKPPTPGKERLDSGMNPAIGREERDEFWTVFPDIQIAAMKLHLTMIQRLEENYVPLAQDTLDQALRIFQSLYRLPQARTTIFLLVKDILHLCGPTLPKFTVESLGLLIKCCCRDLLGAAGCLPKPKPQNSATTTQNGQKPKTISQNADAFLPTKSQDDTISVSLSAEHLCAGEALLTALLSHLPQQHIPSSLRSQLVKTAILSRNRDAQLASILHPARDKSGRTPQVILPYLARQFPQDESVEVLRFNFRPAATGPIAEFLGPDDDDDAMIVEGADEETQTQSRANGFSFDQASDAHPSSAPFAALPAPTSQFRASSPIPLRSAEVTQSPFLARPSTSETVVQSQSQSETTIAVEPASTSALKRKNEDATAEISLSKRVEIDASIPALEPAVPDNANVNSTTTVAPAAPRQTQEAQTGEDQSSDDESVHLNMELDSEDEDDE